MMAAQKAVASAVDSFLDFQPCRRAGNATLSHCSTHFQEATFGYREAQYVGTEIRSCRDIERNSISPGKWVSSFLNTGSSPQHQMQMVLYANDGSSQAFISRTLQKDTAAIKRTIDNLEKRGLVKRVQNSGRDYKVFVTDRGLELRDELFRQVDMIRERVFDGVTPQEIDTVLGFIEKVMKNVSEPEKP